VLRWSLRLIFILVLSSARADSPLRQSPVGFCSLSSMSAATSLTSCTTTVSQGVTITGIPTLANWALVCAYVQGIVWNDDEAPTTSAGSGGQGLAAGQCFGYSGPLSSIQFIQQTSGAILGVSFYK
jgi:hypothetical protein